MSYFKALKGEATTGKEKVWSINVYEESGSGIIETKHGYRDGKQQVNKKIITEGKNIGKKNETTPFQQALAEAKATWTKKVESGYTDDISVGVEEEIAADAAEVAEGRGKGIDADVPSPMLAHDYNKRGKGALFPCFVQRKYDGVRCIGMPGKGIFSRLKKSFPHMEHIVKELAMLPSDIILDGELYCKELTFQEIVGMVKRETLKKGDEEKQLHVKFHVYDVINAWPYERRYTMLQRIFQENRFQHLVLVQTDECANEDAMKEMHANYVAEGYEGIMLRNKKGAYKNARSVDLLKYKEFFDGEYKIVGYTQGQGLEEGCVIWTCVTETGKTFSCRPRGTRDDRQELFSKGDSYVGKMLTVRYQELTSSEEKVPRFPVGISIRDYE
jgi:ATP-dependent DNA ligase